MHKIETRINVCAFCTRARGKDLFRAGDSHAFEIQHYRSGFIQAGIEYVCGIDTMWIIIIQQKGLMTFDQVLFPMNFQSSGNNINCKFKSAYFRSKHQISNQSENVQHCMNSLHIKNHVYISWSWHNEKKDRIS